MIVNRLKNILKANINEQWEKLSDNEFDVWKTYFDEDEKEEKSCGDDEELSKRKTPTKLSAADGVYTRCELTIQRVETHLLDPSPLSLSSLSRGSSFGEGIEGAVEATTLRTETSCIKEETKEMMSMGENNIDTEHKVTSVEETLSSRNIRVAVVGNVGKSLIGLIVLYHFAQNTHNRYSVAPSRCRKIDSHWNTYHIIP